MDNVYGIKFENCSSNNKITGNFITNNTHGVYLEDSTNHNVISNNIITVK